MASIPVVIVGTTQDGTPITITGLLSYAGLSVGGGPIIPPATPPQPGIPTHPIAPNYPPGNYPSLPIYWPGYPPGWGGYPPLVPPTQPPDGTPPAPPEIEWKVAWSPETGWIVVGIPQGPHPAPSAAT